MTTEIALWIAGQAVIMISAGILAYVRMTERVTKVEVIVEHLESSFEIMMGKALRKMHSPDDHLGLDDIIDEYIEKHDLPMDKWIIVRDTCEKELMTNHSPWALMSFGLAVHKLQRYGVKPLPLKNRYQQDSQV